MERNKERCTYIHNKKKIKQETELAFPNWYGLLPSCCLLGIFQILANFPYCHRRWTTTTYAVSFGFLTTVIHIHNSIRRKMIAGKCTSVIQEKWLKSNGTVQQDQTSCKLSGWRLHLGNGSLHKNTSRSSASIENFIPKTPFIEKQLRRQAPSIRTLVHIRSLSSLIA